METIVVSVGGSLIVPEQIDIDFLKHLKELIAATAGEKYRFVIIAGGGRTARLYQEAAGTVSTLKPDDLDWIGIHATRLNGHLLRTILKDSAYPTMITNPDDIEDVPDEAKVIIAAGYRPGSSTDLRAVQIAKLVGAHKVINLSNIDYVYTSDPKIDPAAKPIKEITWSEFRQLIPERWDPGLSSPFDPVAAREAEANQIEVVCINGASLAELHKYLKDQPFVGTLIHT